jgi:hypothetical protein
MALALTLTWGEAGLRLQRERDVRFEIAPLPDFSAPPVPARERVGAKLISVHDRRRARSKDAEAGFTQNDTKEQMPILSLLRPERFLFLACAP